MEGLKMNTKKCFAATINTKNIRRHMISIENHRLLALSFLLVCSFIFGLLNLANASQENIDVVLSMEFSKDSDDVYELVENQVENYLKSNDIKILRDKEARVILSKSFGLFNKHISNPDVISDKKLTTTQWMNDIKKNREKKKQRAKILAEIKNGKI